MLALSAYARTLKCFSVYWRLGINTSINNAVLYIGASFNYIEVFSLLWLTVLTRTWLKELYEVCHFLECPLTAWGFLTANNESVPFKYSVHPYHNPCSLLLFLQDQEESLSWYIKSINTQPFLDPVMLNHKYYGC